MAYSNREYFYADEQKPIGPHDYLHITDLIRSGKISSKDWIYTQSTDWASAVSFSEFKELFGHDAERGGAVFPDTKSIDYADNEVSEFVVPIPLIHQNPFRLLGIPLSASGREIERSFSMAKTFSKVGKVITQENEFGLSVQAKVDEEILKDAKAQMDLPESRLIASLFWFWEGSAVDKIAFEHLRHGEKDRALEIWNKVVIGKPINKTNFSSARNLATYHLANCGSQGPVEEVLLQQSLQISGRFFCSDSFNHFLDYLPFDTHALRESNRVAGIYAEKIVHAFEDTISESTIGLEKFISFFDEFPSSVIPALKDKYTKFEINALEKALSETKSKAIENGDQGYQAGVALYEDASKHLPVLEKVLGLEDIKYESLCSSIASQMEQCSVFYYNFYQSKIQPDDFGENLIELIELGLRVYSNDKVGEKLRDGLGFYKAFVIRRFFSGWEVKEDVIDLVYSLTEKLKNAEKLSSISEAMTLVEECKPLLQSLSGQVSPSEFFACNDRVALVAMNLCIKKHDAATDELKAAVCREALDAMEVIGTLEISDEFKQIHRENVVILSGNIIHSPPKKSGCYIATMVYGSPHAEEVMILKNYRDRVLIECLLGRVFIYLYYMISPTIVSVTRKQYWLHAGVRCGINLLITRIKNEKN